jgi:hypothetical protein
MSEEVFATNDGPGRALVVLRSQEVVLGVGGVSSQGDSMTSVDDIDLTIKLMTVG